jgi:transposase
MILFGQEVFMTEKRRSFTREFKLEAVRLVTDGKQSVSQVSLKLGIRPDMLRAWKRQVEGGAGSSMKDVFRGHGKVASQEEEVRRLRREVERLNQEREFLKKAAAYFAKEQS